MGSLEEVEMTFWQHIGHTIKSHTWYVFVILVLLVFIVKGCTSSTTTEVAGVQTYTVVSGSIENSLEVLGTTSITNLQTLVFGTEGKVTKIYVKEGDKVKAGDLLAELDKQQLNISLSQQSLSVQNARINYDNLINQYTEADVVGAEKNVSDTQSKLDIAKDELETLKSEQGDTVQSDSTKLQSILLNTKTTINNGKDILDSVDEIFYISKTNNLYMDIQHYISAKNTQYRNSTETNYYISKNKLTLLESTLSSVQGQSSVPMTAIQDLQQNTKDFLSTLETLVASALNAVDNSVDGQDLPLSTINSRSSTMTSARSTVLSRLSTLNSDISSLQNMANDVASKENEIKNYEAQLVMYQETLQEMKEGPDYNTKTLQLNSIKQSQLSLQQTSQQKDNYEIRAPFDGTIDAIGFKVGDTVSSNAGTSANGITMSNPDIYEVTMLIDQIDIVKIDKGQIAEITFDAYPGYSVTGAISNIDPTPITSAGVVSYYASIALQRSEKKMYDGMTVTVKIILEKKDDVLVVPTAGLQTIRGNVSVLLMSGTRTIPKLVEVGISDGVNSEVLSGLSLGDVVSLTTYTTSATTTSTTRSDMGSSMGSMRALNGGSAGGPGGDIPPN